LSLQLRNKSFTRKKALKTSLEDASPADRRGRLKGQVGEDPLGVRDKRFQLHVLNADKIQKCLSSHEETSLYIAENAIKSVGKSAIRYAWADAEKYP
jgi:hypothetical protein